MGRASGVERGLFLITAIALSLPAAHPANTVFILESTVKNRADCSANTLANTPWYPFDAIGIPGAGIVIKDGVLLPSKSGRDRLEAGAFAYAKGLAPIIILLDGTSKPGEESVSRDYLRYIAPDIPDETTLAEYKSFNTATNMEQLAKIAKEKGTRDEKRDLILELGQNLILKDKKLEFKFKQPYDVLLLPEYRTDMLALLNTFRTYEWTKPYQPLDYSLNYMPQILYQ